MLLLILFFLSTSALELQGDYANDANVRLDSVTIVTETDNIALVDKAAAMGSALTNLGLQGICGKMVRQSKGHCHEFWRVKPTPCPLCDKLLCSKPAFEKVKVCYSFDNWNVQDSCSGCGIGNDPRGRGHGRGGGLFGNGRGNSRGPPNWWMGNGNEPWDNGDWEDLEIVERRNARPPFGWDENKI